MSENLQQQQNNGDLKRLKIPRGVISANHAQFANDAILLGGARLQSQKKGSKEFSPSSSNPLMVRLMLLNQNFMDGIDSLEPWQGYQESLDSRD